MGKWSYHRRCLLLYLVIAGIALSGICVYTVCAERELSQRDPSQSDVLPEQLSESFALLYYMANGRSHAALLDPDAELPQVLTDDFFNQLDQRCAQLANEGETQFYYRILDGAGEEIAASQPVSAGNVALHLRIVFDAQGQMSVSVNGEQRSDAAWVIPGGMQSVHSIYAQCFSAEQMERYGISDPSLQQQLNDVFIEALHRPVAANVTYELTFTDNSAYLSYIYDGWSAQLQTSLALWGSGILLVLAIVAGLFVFCFSFEELKEHALFAKGRVPFALVALVLAISLQLYEEKGRMLAGTPSFPVEGVLFIAAGLCALLCWMRLLFSMRCYRQIPYHSYVRDHFLIVLVLRGHLGSLRQLLPRAILYLFALGAWVLCMCAQGHVGIILLCLCQLWALYVAVCGIVGLHAEYQAALAQMTSLHEKEAEVRFSLLEGMGSALAHSRERFEQAVNEELRSQRMKNELITNVSHDLKTPLTSIRGYVDLLRQQPPAPLAQTYLEKLDGSVGRLTALVEDLFDVSRADSGNLHLRLEPVALGELVRQVVFEHAQALQEKGLTIRMEGFQEEVMIFADSEKTCRIFDNLIRNCVKYAMPDTRVYLVLSVEEQACVRIKNISEHEICFDAREILERFVRGDASRSTEGSGLGLAIVRSFAAAQQGSFHVEIDGDLFKAVVRLPLASSKRKEQGG